MALPAFAESTMSRFDAAFHVAAPIFRSGDHARIRAYIEGQISGQYEAASWLYTADAGGTSMDEDGIALEHIHLYLTRDWPAVPWSSFMPQVREVALFISEHATLLAETAAEARVEICKQSDLMN